MNASKTVLSSLTCSIALTASLAPADDLTPPVWRGDPGSTFQHWGFNQPGAGPPDSGLNNPYGTPFFVPDPNALWEPVDPSGQRTGVYFINFDWDLSFEVPNVGDQTMEKELWLQVTYTTSDGIGPSTSVIDTSTGAPFTLLSTATTDLGGGLFHDLHIFSYTDCPPNELVSIFPGTVQSPAWVDQVVIDTRCVPAPAGLALLAVGGLAVARRRRA